MTASPASSAVIAGKNSIKYAMEGHKDQWLALYDDQALLRYPAGKSPLDPEGNGHQGIEAIERFWDEIIAKSNITITPVKFCPSGNHACAIYTNVENDIGNGLKTHLDMIAIYEINESGKIVTMSAYWDYSELEKQLAEFNW